jgi:hypothetical protein
MGARRLRNYRQRHAYEAVDAANESICTKPDPLVAVERDHGRVGDHAARPLPHEVRPFPLPALVLGEEIFSLVGQLPGRIDEGAGEPRQSASRALGLGTPLLYQPGADAG